MPTPLEDLALALQDPRFADLDRDTRKQVVDLALDQSASWLQQQEDWGPEAHRRFGEVAAAVRERAGEESAWETTKRYGGVALKALGDTAAAAGSMALDVSPVKMDAGGELGLKLPGEGVGTALGTNLARLDASMETFTRSALSKTDAQLEEELEKLRQDLDQGNFPFGDRTKFEAWLGDRSKAIGKRQEAYWRTIEDKDAPITVTEEATLAGNPDHLALLGRYTRTRDPEAWDALRSSLLGSPLRKALDESAREQVRQTGTGKLLEESFGEGGVQSLTEAGDPFEVAGAAIPLVKGAKVVAKGRKLMQRGRDIGAGAGGEVLSEQGSLFVDDPNATWGQRLQTAKDSLAAALGLMGAGAAAGGSARILTQKRGKSEALPRGGEPEPVRARGEAAPAADVAAELPAAGVSEVSELTLPVMAEEEAAEADGLPTGAGEIDDSLLTRSTFVDPAGTVPELPATIQEQAARVDEGLKPAALIPGATVEEAAEIIPPAADETLTQTEAGAVLHKPEIISPELAAALVAEDRTGELLGFGTPRKPEGATHAIVHRAEDGTPVSDQAVTGDTIEVAIAAAARQSKPGDTIELTTPRAVIEERLAALDPEAPSETAVAGAPVVEIPIADLQLSEEVPQFKKDADAAGVVEPLGGKFDRRGVGPIQIWQRLDGRREIISGRHRYDLAKRSGEKTIPAQIYNEADGFTARDAATLDAELNIRDGQGSVADFANYFRSSPVTEQQADTRGLLARAKGKAGFRIGRLGSEDTFSLHQSGKINDAQAEAIAAAAPGDAGAQAVGIRAALAGQSAAVVQNLIKAARLAATERAAAGEQGDLFGFDDSAMRQMEQQAKAAAAEQKAIRDQIGAVRGAAKRPDVARKLGVNVADPEGVLKRIEELSAELQRWENWPMHPDLVAKTRGETLAAAKAREDLKLVQQSDADVKAERAAAAAAAQRAAQQTAIADRAAAPLQGDSSDVGQGRLFEEDSDLFSGPSAQQQLGGPGGSDVAEWGESQFARRVQELGGTGTPEAETPQPAPSYVIRKNADTARMADDFIRDNGLENSVQAVMDQSSELEPLERTAIGILLLKRLDAAAVAARRANDQATFQKWDRAYGDLREHVSLLGTEAGQVVQAYGGLWGSLSPERTLREGERVIAERGRKLTPEKQQEFRELVREANAAPEGSFIQQQLNQRLAEALAREAGISPLDILIALWYANILSGINTQAVNAFGSGAQLLMRGVARALVSNRRDTAAFVRGMIEGAKVGALDFKAAWKGEQRVRFDSKGQPQLLGKFEHVDALEAWHRMAPAELVRRIRERNISGKDLGRELAALGRFVFRLMRGVDCFFYRSAYEANAYSQASEAARAAAKDGGDYRVELARRLGNTVELATQARDQALRELEAAGMETSVGNITRRTLEIMDAQRPAEIRTESQRFGLRMTFNQDPEGSMGVVAGAFNWLVRELVIPTKWGDVPVAKPFVPFVRIVANVASEGMDFIPPIGFARAIKGSHLLGKDEVRFSPAERRERAAAAAIGGLAMAVIGSAVAAHLDEEDPAISLTALGPEDANKRHQLRQRGWQPFTLKVGDVYVKYNETPLAAPLAILGGFFDRLRYKKDFRNEGFFGKVGYALALLPKSYLDSGFLSSAANLLDLVEGRRSAAQEFGRMAQGVYVPAQGLLRDLARITDPEIPDRTVAAAFFKDVPFIEGLTTRPALNVFGEPVKIDQLQRVPAVSRFASRQTEDPDAAFLAQHGLWVPGLEKTIALGGYIPKEQKGRTFRELQRRRAETLGAQYGEVLTADEAYRFVQIAGPRTRQAVQQLRRDVAANPKLAAGPKQLERLQERLQTKVQAQRKVAMKELIRELR